jgi:hypothetical protein
VVALMAVLTAGWPLVSAAVHNPRPVAARTGLTVGSSRPNLARFTVGPGWSMLRAGSNARQDYLLRRGPVRLSIRYVALVSSGQVAQLWAGLHTVLRLSNPGVALSQPRPVVTAQGHRGLTGVVTGRGVTGTVTILPAPSRRFAIQVLVLGPPRRRVTIRGVELRLVRSVFFPAAR